MPRACASPAKRSWRRSPAHPTGSRAVFYTRLWTLGRGLALIELAHERVGAGDAALKDAVSVVERSLELRTERAMADRIAKAAIVVSGRVGAVREPESEEETEPQLSEHDPQWREAVISVREVVKGFDADFSGEIVVRFAASIDVMWAGAPKFEVGQEGIFMLDAEWVRVEQPKGAAKKSTGTLVDPANFLPLEQLDRVRNLAKNQG